MNTTQPEGTYWHFLRADRRLRYSDSRTAIVGETLNVYRQVKLCECGLHASKQAMDALKYAPGSVVCLVTLGGDVIHGGDKSVAQERTALWIFDATRLLREFACNVAENALFAERAAGHEPDPASFTAIEVSRRYAKGEATEEERYTTYTAAYQAYKVACERAAHGAAHNAAYQAASCVADGSPYLAARRVTDGIAYDAARDAAQAEHNALLTSMLLAEYAKSTTDKRRG